MERRKLPTDPFEGFTVVIPGNHTMECNRWIPDLQVNIGDYTVKDNFHVVNVADTNMVLGVQWLYSIGEHSVNYHIPQISFKDAEGKLLCYQCGRHQHGVGGKIVVLYWREICELPDTTNKFQ